MMHSEGGMNIDFRPTNQAYRFLDVSISKSLVVAEKRILTISDSIPRHNHYSLFAIVLPKHFTNTHTLVG